MRSICLFFVYPLINGKPDESKLETILTSKKQIIPWIRKKCLVNNWSHFKDWCNLRKLDFNDDNNQDEYIDTCLDPLEDKNSFYVEKIKYNKEALASILRISNLCTPLGLPWETKEEEEAFKLMYKEYLKMTEKAKEDINKEKCDVPLDTPISTANIDLTK